MAENAIAAGLVTWKAGYPETDDTDKKCVYRGASMEIFNAACDGFYDGAVAGEPYLGYLCEARVMETWGDVDDGVPITTCVLPFVYDGVTYDACAPANTDTSNVGKVYKKFSSMAKKRKKTTFFLTVRTHNTYFHF